MEGVKISSENVRPSSPTPRNLRSYKFSMLDQLSQSELTSLVLYFPNNTVEISDPNSFIPQTTQGLKRSLSAILTPYYPLAGRVNKDGESIDCDDQGVPFVVVKFTGQKLSDVLRNNVEDKKFGRCLLPCELTLGAQYGPDSSVVLIQINYFDCGGIAVGAVFAHRVADATTIAKFLNSWAAATLGCKEEAVGPNYILQSIFPHKEEVGARWQLVGLPEGCLKTGKPVMSRYVFDASAISSLKSKSAGTVQSPTRVEVVSAFIWKCFMAASRNISAASAMAQAVNLRRRAHPPFTSDCFGNFLGVAVAVATEKGNDLGLLVKKMRGSISKVDNDAINRMLGDNGLSGFYHNVQMTWSQVPKDVDVLFFTSWCGLGFYATDFGWGKPIWIAGCGSDDSGPNLQFANTVRLIDTTTGGGIEAWIKLDEKTLFLFDNIEELRALASCDPSPLDNHI